MDGKWIEWMWRVDVESRSGKWMWKVDVESGAVPDLTPRWRVNLNGPHSQSFIILIKYTTLCLKKNIPDVFSYNS